ncbi:MAG: hypothetical protein JWM34_4429 [Ilumatobacteraceae bacterium]|nr:hypothetical protein [Ilumatobacteraceae bacterium]
MSDRLAVQDERCQGVERRPADAVEGGAVIFGEQTTQLIDEIEL